jgi:polysaccharide export outer membrane protein
VSKSWLKFYIVNLAVFGLVVFFLQGCSSSTPRPPTAQDQISPQQEYTYLVGPGDTVEIFVWSNPELTSTVPVRPDGKITTRLVEEIEASGKTPSQLARDIEKAYSEYVKNAVVSVIVNGFVGVPYQQVRVVGEAAKPLSIPFRKHMTLLDLMIEVGGLTDYADGNNAVLIRNFEGKQQAFIVRLDDLVRGGDITANIALWPGDIIIIPESWF